MFDRRFSTFTAQYRETDLFIGVSKDSDVKSIKDFVISEIKHTWNVLEKYISDCPDFKDSLVPIEKSEDNIYEIVNTMYLASELSGIGPMGAVAGAMAEWIGKKVMELFSTHEIVVENGGDIFINSTEDMNISVFAGKSPLSDRVGIFIPKKYFPLGVCTSSGTVGPSLSFGKADAVMIASKNTAIADAYATAFCNKVQSSDDIENICNEIKRKEDILSSIIIINDKFGIVGKFDLKVFES